MTKKYKMNQKAMQRKKQKRSIGRFCGLIQSDGHISFGVDRDKTIRPYIILTHTSKDRSFLEYIQRWLAEPAQGSISSKIEGPTRENGSLNLRVERQKNCKALIALILKEEKIKGTPLLFDSKRKDFLLVIEVLNLREKQKGLPLGEKQEIGLKMAHIFKEIRQNKSGKGYGRQSLSDSDLLKRLTCPSVEIKNQAANEISKIETKVQQEGSQTLAEVRKNPKGINEALGEMTSGTLDGDGSYSVSLLTHIDQKGRVPFEIVPNLNVTDKKEEDTFLFKIIKAVFGQTTYVVQPQGDGGMRLVLSQKKQLIEYGFPFFEKFPPILQKNVYRLEVLKNVLERLPLTKGNRQETIELVTYIYQTSLYERQRTLEEYLVIVNQYFDKK
jgi:hypothetical protein